MQRNKRRFLNLRRKNLTSLGKSVYNNTKLRVFHNSLNVAGETRSDARMETSEGPRPTVKGTVFSRSAGACPPRSQHGEGQALALR